jgi:hypothetical protein
MTRTLKEPGANAALKRRLERTEAIVSALVADVELIKQRLAKVEVVKAGPQDPAVMEPDQEDPQRPETE